MATSGGPGHVITVLAGKAGCGKTTVATNLAVTLTADGTKRVCLVDLDTASGDVAHTLGLAPERTLGDLTTAGGTLRRSDVAAVLTPYREGLDCVLAATRPGAAERLRAPLVEELLRVLPTMYDHVVVDTAPRFTTLTLAALDTSEIHLLVTSPERPSLAKLRRTLDILDKLSYDARCRRILVNHADTRIGMTRAEIEKTVRIPVAGYLPWMWDVPIAGNHGVPLAVARREHPLSRAVALFARAQLSG